MSLIIFQQHMFSIISMRMAIAVYLLLLIVMQTRAAELVLPQALTGDLVPFDEHSFVVSGLINQQPKLSVIEVSEDGQLFEKENYPLEKDRYQGFAVAHLAINDHGDIRQEGITQGSKENDNKQGSKVVSQEYLVLFGSEGISLVKDGKQTLLIEQPSLFSAVDHNKFKHLPLVFDVNGDGLSDFILPDFHQYFVFVQNSHGEFTQSTLAYSPRVSFQSAMFDNTSVQFILPKQIQLIDVNSDNHLDVVFASKHELQYFLQYENGRFDKQPKLMTLPVKLSPPESAVQSFSHTRRYLFNRIDDINVDGIPDIVINKKSYQEKVSEGGQEILVFYGQYDASKHVFYDDENGTSVAYQGELLDYGFADFNGDGFKDIYLLGGDIGASSLMSALWGGSFTVDINIHKLNQQGGFSKTSDISKEVEFIVNMEKVSFGVVVNVADFNGDKRNDLLIQSDEDELAIYLGNDKRLLAKRSKKIDVSLPANPNLVNVIAVHKNQQAKILIRKVLKNKAVKLTLVH